MYKALARAILPIAACLVVGCDMDETPRPAQITTRPPLAPIELSRTGLVAAARAGGDYLVRMQNEDGSFHFLYDAAIDRVMENVDYNILRHAGTAFSLFDLYAATKDPRYLTAANRAVDFLKTRFKPAKEPRAIYVLDDDGTAKLGANGLALLAISRQMELDPPSSDRTSALHLANHIMGQQEADGAFISYHPEGDVSLYYPGEAILGLLAYYRIAANETRVLESARRGADYLIESQRGMPELPPDAWLMQALEALHKLKPDPKYVEHVMALAEAMIRDQFTGKQTPERYSGDQNIGGFGPGEPRVTAAAARSEGILSAYRMARANSDARAPAFLEALKASARFQMQHQFTKDDAGWLPAPEKAAGAFRGSLSSTHVRIDFVQHNISALLGLAQVWDTPPAQ